MSLTGVEAPGLRLAQAADFAEARTVGASTRVSVEEGCLASFELTELRPATLYHYEIAGERGSFRTFPAGAASFTIVLGSCAETGSEHPVFATMARHSPLLFLHTGDLHYEDIAVNDIAVFRVAYGRALGSSAQSALYRAVPVNYVWDDHDFGPNNADRTAPGRTASRLAYRQIVPHYALPAGAGDEPIYHAFTIGRVRFIVLDTRSEKSPPSVPAGPNRTTLGVAQKAWLKAELLAARDTHALIALVSSVSWIADDGSADRWGGFVDERRELADFMVEHNVRNICLLSGDAHMLAIDDGRHNQYATNGGPGFPVFQAAALDRKGSVKGGPYSHGAFPGRGQFGVMRVLDDGGPVVRVEWSGRNHRDEEIVAHQFTVDVMAAAPAAAP
ncbi:MAG TPA: alkaline phosphatase D family protein [Opitutus sp.]|nr:alkaline phosphatase D family protein [Opitutus sp.]